MLIRRPIKIIVLMGVFFHLMIPHSHCSESFMPIYNIIASQDCVIPDDCGKNNVHNLLHGSETHHEHADAPGSDRALHFSDTEFTVKYSKSVLLKLQATIATRFTIPTVLDELSKSELNLTGNNSQRLPQPPYLLTSRNKAPPA